MIRLVCICGKHLRARDEASLRRAVCPSCGCPVGKSRIHDDAATGESKPLTMKDGPLGGVGYVVVPLWEEGQSSRREVPRYKVVTVEESTVPPAFPNLHEDVSAAPDVQLCARDKNRKRTRRRSKELNTSLEETLLFPLLCWRSVLFLALVLGFVVFCARAILANSNPDLLWVKLIAAFSVALFGVAYCGGYWMVVFRTTMRGEDSVVLWHGWASRDVFIHMLRCLVCFFAGPAWLLAIAGYYWFNGGDLALLDKLILAELTVAALMYWLFSLTAVTADNSIRSILPTGVVGLLQRLGWRASLLASMAVILATLLLAGACLYSLTTLSENGWSWLLLVTCCAGSQVFLALFSRWLGVQCFLAERAARRREKEKLNAQPGT